MERRLEKQAEEITWAAREITEAVRELKVSVERLVELQQQNVPGGLPEEEADRIAIEAVREVRADIAREREAAGEKRLPPPTPEEIREWERRREERRRREGYQPLRAYR